MTDKETYSELRSLMREHGTRYGKRHGCWYTLPFAGGELMTDDYNGTIHLSDQPFIPSYNELYEGQVVLFHKAENSLSWYLGIDFGSHEVHEPEIVRCLVDTLRAEYGLIKSLIEKKQQAA